MHLVGLLIYTLQYDARCIQHQTYNTKTNITKLKLYSSLLTNFDMLFIIPEDVRNPVLSFDKWQTKTLSLVFHSHFRYCSTAKNEMSRIAIIKAQSPSADAKESPNWSKNVIQLYGSSTVSTKAPRCAPSLPIRSSSHLYTLFLKT